MECLGFRFLVFAWVCLASFRLGAQEAVWVRLGMRDGLPQTTVTCLLEDRDGFLWAGTMDGVVRLAAEGVERLQPPGGYRSREVRRMLQASDGTLWVAHVTGSLLSIRSGQVRRWTAREGLPEDGCYALVEDAGGRIHVAARGGLFRLEGETFRPLPLPQDWRNRTIWALAADGDRVWCADRGGRLALWDGQVLTPSPQEWPEGILDLARGPDGRLWLLSREGLWWLESGEWRRSALARGRHLGAICGYSEAGTPLVGDVRDGLWTLDGAGRAQKVEGPPQATPTCALRDRWGRLWVATLGQGLAMRPEGGLQRLPPRQGQKALGGVWALLEDGARMLAGTDTGLHAWVPGRGWDRLPLEAGPTYALLPDGEGGVWAGTQGGLFRVRSGRVQRMALEGTGFIGAIVGWERGLALGTQQGVVLLDGHANVLQRCRPEGNDLSYVQALLVRNGQLLAGMGSGLWRVEGGRMLPFDPAAPFVHAQVQALWEDPEGRLWVASGAGLFRQKGGGWEAVSPCWEDQDGVVSALLGVRGGTAVGHGRGLTLLTPNGAIRLGRNQGLLGEEVGHGALCEDREGRLWVGCSDGVYRIDDPGALRPRPLPPPVVMARAGSLGPRDLAFSVRTPLPLAPFLPQVQYRVEGLEGAPSDLGPTRDLLLGQLAPGTYGVLVQARLEGEGWVGSQVLDVVIHPLWYQHPVFRGGLACLALTGLGLGWRWRGRILRRRNAQLAEEVARQTASLSRRNTELEAVHDQVRQAMEARIRQTRGVVHDLRGPLTAISLVAERLVGRVGNGDGRFVSILQAESGRLEELLKQLLDEARMQHMLPGLQLRAIRPYEVFEGLLEALKVRAEAKGLVFRFQEAPDSHEVVVQGDPLALQQVLLNLVGNALKFTERGTVEIHSWKDATHWILEVRDTGRGMAPEEVARVFSAFSQAQVEDAAQGWGLGLSIVQALVERHRGEIGVDSLPGLGSAFRVRIPLA